MYRRILPVVTMVLVLALAVSVIGDGAPPIVRPGRMGNGVTMLPNGWKIFPVGWHAAIGDLPLAMAQSPDGRYLIVENNGYTSPSVTVFDTKRNLVVQRLVLDHAWLGLAWGADGKHVYVSGAANNTVHELLYSQETGMLTRGLDLTLGRPLEAAATNDPDLPAPVSTGFIGGLTMSPDGGRLFAVQVLGQAVSVVDVKSGRVLHTIGLPAEPYTATVAPDGATLFVSLWGGAKVLFFDTRTFEPRGDVAVGEHPNAMAVTRDGKKLFVACANTNRVWVIDIAARHAVEQISTALYPNAPPGTTPNHVSLSPDGTRLLVANADNNTVAVVDVSNGDASQVLGFIPTGWYPTAAMYSRDGSRIFITSGKGLTSSPNPRGNQPGIPGAGGQYVAELLQGTLSIVGAPSVDALRTMTDTVRSITPYTDANVLTPAHPPVASPIPKRVGDPSPIKHVFYIIRENCTYDQILGDVARGNGDPALCLFGEDVTPNAHAVVREFGLLDNFYVDAEVSYDGHSWSMAAYAPDLIEKLWPTNYAIRGFPRLNAQNTAYPQRNAYGNIAAPMDGFIWDAAGRKGVSFRSYGEYVVVGPDKKNLATVPGLRDHIAPEYPPYNLSIPDERRVDAWTREFRAFEEDGRLPALSIIRLGNDHTNGARPGVPTPRAYIAENDVAIGRVIETIAHSTYWKESAIFVLEDDAQDGPDHIDAHRSPVLMISPFSRRGAVDSTLYTTSSVLRTMELILGLPPMSQYDAAATPMYNAFQATPVLTPFTHLSARVPLDEKNDQNAWGAEASMKMNFADADLAPERELNEILWHSVKGSNSVMPPPVHAAFVRSVGDDTVDDDDRAQ